ncbi:MAG TPA: nitrilase-related carbon-nitrogen hydrolase [Candidatus Udaeobacter sp.]|nr:nitrilase-related carbon-nitrogen hydrolase [Candidatus Udaeobacter sp.]
MNKSGDMLDSEIKVAAVQFNAGHGNIEGNRARMLELLAEAAEQGARLIVFPEMASSGYVWDSREEIAPFAEPVPGPTTDVFHAAAKRYGCYAVVGLPERDAKTGAYYNSAVLIGPEGVVGTYRKTHLFAADPRWAREGTEEIPVFETSIGRIAMLICMDAMYFEPARIAALKRADIIAFPTNWVGGGNNPPSRTWCLRAKENGLYWVAANRSDHERGAQFTGGSAVIDQAGDIQSMLLSGQGIVYGAVKRNSDKREQMTAARRPGAYGELLLHPYLWQEGETRSHSMQKPFQLITVPVPEEEGHFLLERLTQAFLTAEPLTDQSLPRLFVLPEVEIDPALISRERVLARLQAMASDYRSYIAIGIAEREPGNPKSTAVLVGPEGIAGISSAIHGDEDRLRKADSQSYRTYELPFARVGILMDADGSHPESYRVLAKQGADIVAISSSAKERNTAWMKRIWAFENDLIVAAAAPGGSGESLLFLHRQTHIEGDMLAGPLIQTFDTAMTEQARKRPFMRRLKTHMYDRLVISAEGGL